MPAAVQNQLTGRASKGAQLDDQDGRSGRRLNSWRRVLEPRPGGPLWVNRRRHPAANARSALHPRKSATQPKPRRVLDGSFEVQLRLVVLQRLQPAAAAGCPPCGFPGVGASTGWHPGRHVCLQHQFKRLTDQGSFIQTGFLSDGCIIIPLFGMITCVTTCSLARSQHCMHAISKAP